MKKLWALLFFPLLLIACGGERELTPEAPPPPSNPPGKVGDVSKMPLEQGLRTKYSKLQLVCDYQTRVIRPIAGGQRISDTNNRFILWDILEDYSPNKEITLNHNFEEVRSQLSWDFELKMLDQIEIYDNWSLNHKTYELLNAIALIGNRKYRIDYREKSGKVGFDSGNSPNEKIYDRVPIELYTRSLEKSGDENFNTFIKIECFVDATVNSGFEDQFTVIE